MLGIVLAAGDATRLPNKPLLPIRGNQIAIESAIEFCKANCDRTIIVVSPNRIVQTVLKMRGHDLGYVVQPASDGVPDAISRAAVFAEDEKVLVTFCDNIYPEGEGLPTGVTGSVAATRNVERHWEQLDRYDRRNREWVGRSGVTDGRNCLAGWYLLTAEAAMQGHHSQSSVDFLNLIKADTRERGNDGWFDIGTPEAYLEYLRS